METQNTPQFAGNENLISIIIPTFNRRNYLGETIDSVLSQTYKNYELIIIDDGSTDGTKEFLESHYGDSLRYIWQPNQGRSKARNTGLSEAKGKYVAFLDSDDLWLPTKLEKQVLAFTSHKANEIAAVCSSVYFIDECGKLIHKSALGQHKQIYDYELERFLSSSLILAPPSNMLIRKQCLDEIAGFDENLSFGEDWDLIIRLRNKWRFYYIDEPLVKFRFSSKFVNRLPQMNQISGIVNDQLRIFEKIGSNPEFQVDKKKLIKSISGIWEKAAYWYYANEEYFLAADAMIRNDCFENIDHDHFCDSLGYWGSFGAISKFRYDPLQCENFFQTNYLPGVINSLKDVFPFTKRELKIIQASFYHNLGWHLFPKVNGKPIIYLNIQAIKYNRYFLLSKQTWKLLCISFISWMTSGHKNGNNT